MTWAKESSGAVPGATPTQIDIGDGQVGGADPNYSRNDHQHAFPAPVAGYPVDVDTTEADGTAITVARADHRHTIANNVVTFARMQDIASPRILGRFTAASGDPEELNLGTQICMVGTAAAIPAAGIAGRIYVENDTGLVRRDTGTSWNVIATGIGYATVSQIADVAATEAEGTSLLVPRGDHVHRMGILTTKGDFLTHNGTDPIRAAIGADDMIPVAQSGDAKGWVWTAPGTPVRSRPGQDSADGAATANDYARSNHIHESPGVVARIVAEFTDAGTAESQVVGWTYPASYLKAGMIIHLFGAFVMTTDAAPGTSTFRVRIDNATTLLGTIIASLAPAEVASITNGDCIIDAYVTIRTAGAPGSCIAVIRRTNGAIFTQLVGLVGATATSAVTTTVSRLLELTYQTSDAGTNTRCEQAFIEILSMN